MPVIEQPRFLILILALKPERLRDLALVEFVYPPPRPV